MLVSKRIPMNINDEKLSRVPAEPNATFIDAATPLVLDGNYKYGLYKCQLYKDVTTMQRIIQFSNVAHPKIRLEHSLCYLYT